MRTEEWDADGNASGEALLLTRSVRMRRCFCDLPSMSDFNDSNDLTIDVEKPKYLGFFFGIEFYPKIKLEKKFGMAFGTELTEFFDTEGVDLQSNEWSFGLRGDLQVSIKSNRLEFHSYQPSSPMERYEERYRKILELFDKHFGLSEGPSLITSKAMLRVLFPASGDAREFLAQRVMELDPDRLAKLGRPVHLLGVRFNLPPISEDEEEEAEATEAEDSSCSVEARIESYAPDPKFVFVQVDARWETLANWDSDQIEHVAGRLGFVERYVANEIVALLTYKPE